MFATLGNSFRLLRVSWRILTSDRELIFFPLLAGGALFLVFAYAAAAFWAGGTFDRIGVDYRFSIADFLFLTLAYFLASFVVVFFTAALSAAAYQRLEGFDPNLSSGLIAANDRLASLAAWSVLTASVILVLNQLTNSRSLLGRIFGAALRMMWSYTTFFVVPVIVIENANPLEALGRSTELFRQHWGKTLVANFGFGIGYGLAVMLALAPAALFYFALGSVFLAVTVGATLLTLSVAVVMALEIIYRVALYDYAATGRVGEGFSTSMMQDAYVSSRDRGRFQPEELRSHSTLRRPA